MIQSIESTGKTTEDALKAALEELGMTRQGELPYSPGSAGRKQAQP